MTLAERDLIIDANMHRVKILALMNRHRLPASMILEDLISVGMLALVEAAGTFEEGHGIKAGTWICRKVHFDMLDEIRRFVGRTAHKPHFCRIDNLVITTWPVFHARSVRRPAYLAFKKRAMRAAA